jgi:hypothetical protein
MKLKPLKSVEQVKVSEAEIQRVLESNLDQIEEGLKLVGSFVRIGIGVIDTLALDEDLVPISSIPSLEGMVGRFSSSPRRRAPRGEAHLRLRADPAFHKRGRTGARSKRVRLRKLLNCLNFRKGEKQSTASVRFYPPTGGTVRSD